jgi:DNA-directed RNA polymerase specialized sigma24 family protein
MRRLPTAVKALPESVRVDAAIEALPTRDRHVLTLLLVERLTPIEAAGVLHMTVRQVELSLEQLLARIASETGVSRSRLAQRRIA